MFLQIQYLHRQCNNLNEDKIIVDILGATRGTASNMTAVHKPRKSCSTICLNFYIFKETVSRKNPVITRHVISWLGKNAIFVAKIAVRSALLQRLN
jgi:hypothetical protein